MTARVRSVGAIATISRVEQVPGRAPLALPRGAITPIRVLLRPFAKLAEGTLAISPTTTTIAIVPERLGDLEAEARRVLGMLPSTPAEPRPTPWAGVLAELRRLRVQAEAEALLSLEFDLVTDAELRAALHAGSAAG